MAGVPRFCYPMAESPLTLLLLAINSVCLALTAMAVVITARELRTTLRRLNAVLPEADRALREARRSLHHVRRITASGHQAARRVETVVHRACDIASDALERLAWVKSQTEHVLFGRVGNGTRGEPRPHHRRGS